MNRNESARGIVKHLVNQQPSLLTIAAGEEPFSYEIGRTD